MDYINSTAGRAYPPPGNNQNKDFKMKKNFQLTIDPMTDKKDIKEAKSVVKAIKKSVDGGYSALECMELETESVYQVTTYRNRVQKIHDCYFRRITPLQIEVEVQYGTAYLTVSWIAEGIINDKPGMAKITAHATWQDGWYVWDDSNEDGTPKAPYAEVYSREADI